MTRPDTPKRNTAIIGLILHFPLATLASIDWFMSLEPHWYSTIYGVLFLASQALTAYAFVVALLLILPTPAPEESDRQTRQDLGNVLMTILITATYLQFMQFLVIWAGDLPEEISWYLARTAGGWSWVALILIVFSIVVPFVLLLSRGVKSRIRSLGLVALLMLVAQFVYAYWLILPAFDPSGATVDWLALILPAGMAGASGSPPLPIVCDPSWRAAHEIGASRAGWTGDRGDHRAAVGLRIDLRAGVPV